MRAFEGQQAQKPFTLLAMPASYVYTDPMPPDKVDPFLLAVHLSAARQFEEPFTCIRVRPSLKICRVRR